LMRGLALFRFEAMLPVRRVLIACNLPKNILGLMTCGIYGPSTKWCTVGPFDTLFAKKKILLHPRIFSTTRCNCISTLSTSTSLPFPDLTSYSRKKKVHLQVKCVGYLNAGSNARDLELTLGKLNPCAFSRGFRMLFFGSLKKHFVSRRVVTRSSKMPKACNGHLAPKPNNICQKN